ncbi:putative GPI-anchored cell surface glycoprotein [Aspergillus clavatus NRRL 1]|uniref:GPI-anchored cell surface glycoprotein, putative n=1 Tax=Aspergillus clavatus (strain ATCC 1007 / CBS 513.65 / DSM 816 / NCTC 3887 / NRRL 1 / QM 1276 / 107) TaxID=344612 RepID=A1CBH6_ASPCL|nr:GPI-anchored cell surface glycoprotein, putative [Aspergillus clavatus NRRL 1]EAW13094.1 GPI-anchored cell surface glycoprotein, putative [Aspergillus clavatus NRRL 1]
MSLNGLDNPAVTEAYQSALAEAGGWFLLRYVSRDEITLLERGTGGVPEVRSAVDNYEEILPLYGFLQYRRRKVVLSYLPEGLSRLVKARTTVQFQSILDKFSPHDTVFSLTKPTDLTESALSSACLLHAASGSITSSSSSLRRRRLMEIAEDAEENGTSKDQAQTQPHFPVTHQRSFSQLSEATIVPPSVASTVPHNPNNDDSPSITKSPHDFPTSDQASISWESRSEHPDSQRRYQDDLSYAPSEPRKSSQSARPSLRDLERASTYTPKVKRGPRPSVDGNGRPRTAGNLSRSAEQRPVASLPAGVRMSSLRKRNPSPSRPRSQGNPVASISSRTAPPVPPLLVPPLSMPIARPQLSPGAKSLSALSSSGTSNERERLMKALQMRKNQMEKRAAESKKDRNVNSHSSKVVEALDDKENIDHAHSNSTSGENPSTLSDHSEEFLPTTPLFTVSESVVSHETQKPDTSDATKPDSAVGLDISNMDDEQLPTQSLLHYDANLTTELTELKETPEPDQSQILQNDLQSRSGIEVANPDLVVPNTNGTNSASGEPSAGAIEVPLGVSENDLAKEIVHSPEQQEIDTVSGSQQSEKTTDLANSPNPLSIPLPNSPVPSSRPSSPPETTVVAPQPTDPQNDLTPEPSNANVKDVIIRKEKRKPQLEPIQVPTPDYSDDDNLLSDDSFMEELKSATVEEAKPVSVGKSPLSPVYPNNNEQISFHAWKNSRAVSNPSAMGHNSGNMQPLAVGRSVSGPYGDSDGSNAPVLVAKKINVSSGISKRIKALEKFSNSRETSSNSSLNLAPPAASSVEALRKRASASLGVGLSDVGSVNRHSSYTPESFFRSSSLKRQDSYASTNAVRSTASISVAARMVRDASNVPNDSKPDQPETSALNPQASPLTVEQEDSSPTVDESEKNSISPSSTGSNHQSRAASLPRSESRLSISSISKNDGAPMSKSTSDLSSSPEEKKNSRTSRLLRRMSSITSNSKRSVIGAFAPAVKEEETPQVVEPPVKKASVIVPAIEIGEVNVQFPDTLLWKRRFIRIDDKGYLILTPGIVDSSSRNMAKRYHLTEFRTPCIPDEDRQELPNSILLDFLNGSTLQCACESRQGQASVLQTLLNAHNAHQQSTP